MAHVQTDTPNILAAAAAGLVAGLAASFVMDRFQAGVAALSSSDSDAEPATAKAADKVSQMVVGVRLAGVAGALLGLILIARAHDWAPKILGTAIVLSAMAMIAIVPRSLAHRWRSPDA